jgi:hypothetical protein
MLEVMSYEREGRELYSRWVDGTQVLHHIASVPEQQVPVDQGLREGMTCD